MIVQSIGKDLPLRVAAAIFVVGIHSSFIIWASRSQGTNHAIPPPSQIIHASVLAPLPQQNITQAPKPLPAVKKHRPTPEPKIKTIAAPESAPSDSAITAPPQEDDAPETEGSDDNAPFVEAQSSADYLKNTAPDYPRLSRRLGEEGQVVLRVFVEADGKPKEVTIHQSSGFPRLDQAALNAVRQWTFAPAQKGKEAVAAWVLVPINFNLGDQ